jgi:hypothetical protein
MATPKWARFFWAICWGERSVVARALQMSVVTLPALAVLVGWARADWPWWWSVVAFTVAVFAVIFVALARRAYEQHLEREPQVTITGPTILTTPKGASGKAVRILGVEIENASARHLKNCTVRESKFINRYGHDSQMRRHFRLAEELYLDGALSKTFDLRGKGSKQTIHIAQLDETADGSNVLMIYALPSANSIPRSFWPHTLEIEFTADDFPFPEKRAYQIGISAEGILTMTSLENDECPVARF